ncbi:MAG: T9SS type A sorting domain-containing protein [Muribaculaceae bacterium]|nr:T9SS type A sorting domain-containing protein [Muribaculaceae bacterium]
MKRLLIVTQHSLVRFPRKLCMLLLMVAVGSLQILATLTTEIHIKNLDGNILTLPVDESTKITQDGTNLIILCGENRRVVPLNGISEITYKEKESSLPSVYSDSNLVYFQFDGKNLSVEGLNDNEKVCVYTIDGRLVYETLYPYKEAILTIPFEHYSTGIYIVKTSKGSYKFLKR